jgi:hypothetical protein
MVIWVWLNFWIWALRMAVWIVGAVLWCLFDEVFLYKACAGSYLPLNLACCFFFFFFWVCFVAVKVWEENLETKGLNFVFCCIGNQYS